MPDVVCTESAGFSGMTANNSSSFDKSDSAEERAARLAELQEQVGFYTDL